ncbi:MAG: hypothetical protein AB7G93_07740 [Bdellovibrionales bacterium]
MNARNYRTLKGTELPLLNLRGKQYLEVKYRLVWFREDHPDWSIETDLISVTDSSASAKATIRDESGRVIATSHKFESIQGFPDFIEKAETGAIGRALALIGYGTQFCADELDEGKRIVDAPVPFRQIQSADLHESMESNEDSREESKDDYPPGEFTINFGRKYKGKKLKEISRSELEGYIQWLENSSIREGTPLSYQVRYLKSAFDRLYGANAEPAEQQH